MNSALSGSNMLTSMMPATPGNGRSGSSNTTAGGDDPVDFKDIFSGEQLTPEGLAELQKLLPPEQFQQLESLLESGNALPFSADIADSASLPGNPTLLQWMLQLANMDGTGEAIATTPGGQSTPATAVSVADLRALLLRQGGESTTGAGGGPSLSAAADNPALLLSAKGEIPAATVGFKPAFVPGDLPPGLAKADAANAIPLTAAVSGLESLSTQRSESANPPAIHLPTGTKGWDNVLSNRIMWMVGNQTQQASVHISPRHLGPIDIQVSIQNDQTSVSFVAQNAVVKEALEAAIPRLREMFADNNMQLVNVDVGQRDSSGQPGFQEAGGGAPFAANGQAGWEGDGSPEEADPVHTLITSGLVDDYA